MELSIVDEGGLRIVEGVPDQSFMSRVDDANRVIETCFSGNVRHVLLYAANLPKRFFDLSSGLAVVCPAGSVRFSSRFEEMLAEERRRQHFGVFETRDAAREWLGRQGAL
jgi:hypothetical protein